MIIIFYDHDTYHTMCTYLMSALHCIIFHIKPEYNASFSISVKHVTSSERVPRDDNISIYIYIYIYIYIIDDFYYSLNYIDISNMLLYIDISMTTAVYVCHISTLVRKKHPRSLVRRMYQMSPSSSYVSCNIADIYRGHTFAYISDL